MTCTFVMFFVLYCPGGGGGGVLWYFHVYIGSGHFLGVQNFDFIILGVFRKKIFLGVQRFCGYFWGGGGHHKIGLYLGAISIHFRVFS